MQRVVDQIVSKLVSNTENDLSASVKHMSSISPDLNQSKNYALS
jgi:hypothetical protein